MRGTRVKPNVIVACFRPPPEWQEKMQGGLIRNVLEGVT